LTEMAAPAVQRGEGMQMMEQLAKDPETFRIKRWSRLAMWALVGYWTLSACLSTFAPEFACRLWYPYHACDMRGNQEVFVAIRSIGTFCLLLAATYCTLAYQGNFSSHNLISAALGLFIMGLTHFREAYYHSPQHRLMISQPIAMLYLVCGVAFLWSAKNLRAAALKFSGGFSGAPAGVKKTT